MPPEPRLLARCRLALPPLCSQPRCSEPARRWPSASCPGSDPGCSPRCSLESGLGPAPLPLLRRAPSARLEPEEWRWLIGAVAAGGVLGPVPLTFGLAGMAASSAPLRLNAEGVFAAAVAWFAFKENFDRRIALGMGAIVSGAVVLS